MCSFSNSSRDRASSIKILYPILWIKSCSSFGVHTVDFGSFGSSCLSVPGDDPGLELLPNEVEDERGGFVEVERDRVEDFRGTVGDSGDLAAGEGGLLPINTSWVGGMGVLDGRWARSKGMAGNCLMGIGTVICCETSF